MEENNKNKPLFKLITEKDWYKSTWFITACVLIVIIVAYWAFSRINESKKVFTQYDPIDSTRTKDLPAENSLLDTSLVKVDSISLEDPNPPGKNLPPATDTNANAKEKSIFKVNTTYDKIVAEPAPNPIGKAAPGLSGDLFEELLLPENPQADTERSFNEYAQEKMVNAKSVLKLLSIIGEAILLDDNTSENQAILEAITESEHILGILIVDRKGRVVYATNRKYVNGSISNILPKVALDSDKLSWFQEENQTVASLPLFHTYGKIGLAILITT